MKNRDMREIVKTVVSLFLICAVVAGLVAAVNMVTKPRIEEIDRQSSEEARRAVLPEAASFAEKTLADGSAYSVGLDDSGAVVGYVFVTSGDGYGGKVEVMTGILPDGSVSGISFLSINETPGLGMNARRVSWYGQFTGKTGALTVVKNKTPDENEIAAITGATRTSNAVASAVNEARKLFIEAAKGGQAA